MWEERLEREQSFLQHLYRGCHNLIQVRFETGRVVDSHDGLEILEHILDFQTLGGLLCQFLPHHGRGSGLLRGHQNFFTRKCQNSSEFRFVFVFLLLSFLLPSAGLFSVFYSTTSTIPMELVCLSVEICGFTTVYMRKQS